MEIPGIGSFEFDKRYNWYTSEKLHIPALGAQECRFLLEGYDEDERKQVFRTAIENFIAGAYDGHVSNADAYDDPNLEHMVYRRTWG